MGLEEEVGVEQVKERCESCGAQLTDAEIEAAIEGANDAFLCSRCASERVPVEEEAEEL
jgi:Zn finger protein HypA/HybF involved in hydrogenase expression